MHKPFFVLISYLSFAALCLAAEPAERFGVKPDLKAYPQATAKETLASVLKAIEAKEIKYLLAQLAEPNFVDAHVKIQGGKIDKMVQDAHHLLVDDPSKLKALQKLAKEGVWEEQGGKAWVKLKEGDDRRAYFLQVSGRWFFEGKDRSDEVPKREREKD